MANKKQKDTGSIRGAYEDQVKLKDGRLVGLTQYLEEKKAGKKVKIVGLIQGAYETQVKLKSGKVVRLAEFVRSHQKTDEIETIIDGANTSQVNQKGKVIATPDLVLAPADTNKA